MKILFISRQPPVPLDSGGRIRTYALAHELSALSELHFLAFDRQPGSEMSTVSHADVATVLPDAQSITLVPSPTVRKRQLQLRALTTGNSYGLGLHSSSQMAHALCELVEGMKPDILHYDSLFLADLTPPSPSPVVRAIAPHNVESSLMTQMARTTDNRSRRMLYAREAEHLFRWERACLPKFDVCVGVSEADARYFADLGAKTACAPNGVGRRPTPRPAKRLGLEEPLKLLFVGSGSWEPNRIGVKWFLKHVLPAINLQVPPRVTLLGSSWDGLDERQCQIAGNVPSVDPYYESHDVAIVPLLSGGGSRLKVAEALAHGLPIVGTSVGLDGYPLVPGIHASVGDTAETFATEIARLDNMFRFGLSSIDQRVASGYEVVEGFFWDEIGLHLAGVYEDSVARTRGRQLDLRRR